MASRNQIAAPEGNPTRCQWATGPWLTGYHDLEWGVPVHDDRRHLELLTLEGAQAGLSWLTVLKRRDGYRHAFCDFDPAQVARFDAVQVNLLLADPGIIRHRQKVESAVGNAKAVLQIQEELGSFDSYIWSWVRRRPIVNRWTVPEQIPTSTPLAVQLSADLRRRGFRFAGPIVCYSYMQAAGLVLDHLTSCFRFRELGGAH